MKIAVIGTTGFVGSSITKELASRSYHILGISRKRSQPDTENITYTQADVNNVDELASVLKGIDVVVSAFNAGADNPNIYHDYINGSGNIQRAVKKAGVDRYIVIGGAGNLYIADGVQAIDTDTVPAEYKPVGKAIRDYLNVLKKEQELNWTVFSPPFEMDSTITTGRTGKYRLGTSEPVYNQDHRAILSVEDLAVVIADEVDNPKHSREQFTAAY